MQSWGTTSRFDERDSQLEPSKSGVIGLICAALGRDRNEPVDDLVRLRMGVRVDREGVLMRDYQTVSPPYLQADGHLERKHAIVSPRYYLADAAFLVGLEGDDRVLLERIHAALRAPVWTLFLGRKSFPPSGPIWLENAILEQDLKSALLAWPRIAKPRKKVDEQKPLRLVLEDPRSGAMRMDQPVAPFSQRRFGPRYIISEAVDVPV
jgi:CRISPR system Cascade subunit CasD